MKKYICIFKAEMITSLQYVTDVFTRLFVYFIMIFIFINLWKYIYSDSSDVINGYTMNQMIWYVMFSEILWYSMTGRRFCRKICNDVKGGNIIYNLNKPYNYVDFSLWSHLGEILIKSFIFICFGIVIGILMIGDFPEINFIEIVLLSLCVILSLVINTLIIIFIGLFSFIIEDSNPLFWLYSKLILVMGTLFPVEFFPVKIQAFLRYTPVYVISYGPSKLFVNYNFNDFISLIIAQVIYLVVSYGLCMLIYRKGVKKLNVNGG